MERKEHGCLFSMHSVLSLEKTCWQVVLGSWEVCAISQQAGSWEDSKHFSM